MNTYDYMDAAEEKGTDKINKWDWLLIVGLILAPMTGLRVWKVGPAELLCLIWGLRYFPKRIIRSNEIINFFAVFLSAMFVGSVICYFVAPNELTFSGLLTWVYLAFISAALYEGLSGYKLEYIKKLLTYFSVGATVWYLLLYLYSRLVSQSFLGAPLWYGNGVRFSGGGTNPHQVAVLLCGLTFVFISKFLDRKKPLFNLMMAAADIFLIWETKSSTGKLAVFCGIVCLIFIGTAFFNKKRAILLLLAELVLTVLLVLIFWKQIYYYGYNWIHSDVSGEGRLDIFSYIGETFLKSPVFGLGPGTHSRNGTIEYHNTYLEIIAATGCVGAFAFLRLTERLVSKLWKSDWRMILSVISMYIYGVAGFAMRRLVYWGIVIFLWIIAEKTLMEKENNDGEN